MTEQHGRTVTDAVNPKSFNIRYTMIYSPAARQPSSCPIHPMRSKTRLSCLQKRRCCRQTSARTPPEARTPVARFPPSVLDLIKPRRLSCRSL